MLYVRIFLNLHSFKIHVAKCNFSKSVPSSQEAEEVEFRWQQFNGSSTKGTLDFRHVEKAGDARKSSHGN